MAAIKTPNLLNELTTRNNSDILCIWDISEAADEKMKRMTIDSFLADLDVQNRGASSKFRVYNPYVAVNGANYLLSIETNTFQANIAAGVQDSGYRIGIALNAFVNDANFLGTLDEQIGVWSRHGHNAPAGTGTITNSYGIKIDTLSGGSSTITNLWGLYQTDAIAQNYFAGNVGIGTTNPSSSTPNGWLDGKILAIRSPDTSTDSGLLLRRSDNLLGMDLWSDNGVGYAYMDNFWNNSSAKTFLRMRTNGTPINAIEINGTGHTYFGVGISVNSGIAGVQTAQFGNGIPGTLGKVDIIANNDTFAFQVWDDNELTIPRFSVSKAGSVGIGTNSQNYKLHIHSVGSGNSVLQLTNDTTGVTTSDGFVIGIDSSESPLLWNYENTNLTIGTNGLERFRITNDGNISIGYTGVSAITNKLLVSSSTGWSGAGTSDLAIYGGLYVGGNGSQDTNFASGTVTISGTLSVPEKIVIPLNEPSSLENGCIWIV